MAAWDFLTELFAATGGSKILGEAATILGVAGVIPVAKLHNGAGGVDGGPITPTNPLDVRAQGGGASVSTAAQSVIAASDRPMFVLPAAPSGAPWIDFTPISVAGTGGQVIAAASTRYIRRCVVLNLHTASIYVALFNGAGTWGTITNLIDIFSLGLSSASNPRDFTGGGAGAPNGVFCLMSTGPWTSAIVAPAAGCVFIGRSV